jgi:hypothetical protein
MELLLLTADPAPRSVLPALALLPHQVHTAAPEVAALGTRPHDAALEFWSPIRRLAAMR